MYFKAPKKKDSTLSELLHRVALMHWVTLIGAHFFLSLTQHALHAGQQKFWMHVYKHPDNGFIQTMGLFKGFRGLRYR